MDNLTTIKQVRLIDDSDFKQLVSEGWVLLHVCSQNTDNRLQIFYVMGHEVSIEEKESKYPDVLATMLDKYKNN